METVLIESPYGGDVEANVEYAWLCIKDSCQRGEAPFATHLFYTVNQSKMAQEKDGQSDPEHWMTREEGLKRGDCWRLKVDKVCFYEDRGWSSGMVHAKQHCIANGLKFEVRSIHNLFMASHTNQ